jgi:hypothetical protein
MDNGTFVGLMFGLFGLGLGFGFGGYEIKVAHPVIALFSYLCGGGCIGASIALSLYRFVIEEPDGASPIAMASANTASPPPVAVGPPLPIHRAPLAALAIRHVYQSLDGNRARVWLLVSVKADNRPISIVRWKASVKWATSERASTCVFRNTHDLDDDDSLWWQGTHYANNLAWGTLALVPHEQTDGYLHFALENASEKKLSGRIEEVGVEIMDIAGDTCATKKVIQPLPAGE